MFEEEKYKEYIFSIDQFVEKDDKIICPICNKLYFKHGIRMHIKYHFGFTGYCHTAWNKGLTKKDSDIIKRLSIKQSIRAKKNNNFSNYNKTDRHKENARNGGLKSAQITNRRSKNEIYFSELCINYFVDENILLNKNIFNNWDSDVIFIKHKLAILWNGNWHYKKCRKNHSLEQTKIRDKLKIDNILKCNYNILIIKDLGKENKDFVNIKFKELIDIINNYELYFRDNKILEI